ncbi:MAG: FAD-dependent monooxygenase, partial [Bdellovibrionota bacterium]
HWVVETNTTKYTTRVLVGADGRKSIVSKALDNDVAVSERRVALHAYVNMPGLNIRQGEMHIFENGAYIGINPTGEREMNFSLVLDAGELQALGSPLNALNHYISQSAHLKARFKPFEDAKVITAAYPIQHRTKSIIPAHNVALIGDAAGFVDPLTGEGMYNALLSSQLLAEQIEKSFSQSLHIEKKVFVEYERQYSKVLRNKIRLNRFFQILIRHPKLIEVIARFLLTRQRRADAFIGIIGNIYSPFQGFFKLL